MNDSYVEVSKSCVVYAGPDAAKLFQAKALIASLKLYSKTKLIPTRGVTITRMLAMATAITQKPYKRGDAAKAADDVQRWADTLLASLPVVSG